MSANKLFMKSIQTIILLTEPHEIYSNNIENLIMDKLRGEFIGKTFKSCLVVDIQEILQMGNVIYLYTRQNASATCCVRFNAKCIIVKKYEVIHNCVVQKVDKKGHIIARNKYAAIYIKASNLTQTIKQGQEIPVIAAGLIKYTPYKHTISINALPFIPIFRSEVLYEVNITNTTGIVENIYAELKVEMEKANKIKDKNPEVYKFFIDLLYPYKSKTAEIDRLKSKDSARILSIEELLKMKEGETIIISNPEFMLTSNDPSVLLHINVKSDDILDYPELQAVGDSGIKTTESYEAIMGHIIHLNKEFYITMSELCNTYNTLELIKKNNNLWDIFTSGKRA
jgi:hypothetical protein